MPLRAERHSRLPLTSNAFIFGCTKDEEMSDESIQGYLALKKLPHPRTRQSYSRPNTG